MQRGFVEDSDGLHPRPSIIMSRQPGVAIVVPCNSLLAVGWRAGWDKEGQASGGGERGGRVVVVLGEEIECGRGGDFEEGRNSLEAAAREIRKRKWREWMDSGFYRGILRVKLEGTGAKEELDLGRSEWRSLEKRARRYTMVKGRDTRLFWREVDGQLVLCVLEEEVERVLRDVHDGHGHFAAGITAGHAHGKYFWPTRQRDIGRWVASCEACQRMTHIQRCGEIRGIMQLAPMHMIGIDFIGPINPPCEATGAAYIFLVVDYFSRFVLGACMEKADQQSTML